MDALLWVCVISLVLAGLSFLTFGAFSVERIRALRRAAKAAALAHRGTQPRATMDTEVQALTEAPEKVLEALAKLTESLSKAPPHVVALIGSMFFMLVALGAAAAHCECIKVKSPKETASARTMRTTRCVVGYFGAGDHRLPAAFEQAPDRCLDQLTSALRKDDVTLLLIIGRCDFRELRPEVRHVYATNFSLAYQRALAVKKYLFEPANAGSQKLAPSAAERTVLLSAGASSVGDRSNSIGLQRDRVVELVAMENSPI